MLISKENIPFHRSHQFRPVLQQSAFLFSDCVSHIAFYKLEKGESSLQKQELRGEYKVKP